MFDFLFGVPFYKSKIDPESYNKKEIIDDITENYSIDPNRNAWDSGNGYLHHEYGDAGNPKFKSLDYSILTPIYKTHLKNFFNSFFNVLIKYRFDIANYNCFSAGQHMGVHNHPSCDFSAVHYVQFNSEEHHSTRYYNPADWAYYPEFFSKAMNNATNQPLLKNSWKFNTWNFVIDEDDFVITPSSLRHSVPASKSKDLRMVIVLNIYIEQP